MSCLCKKTAKLWLMAIILFLCLPSKVSARDAIDQQREGTVRVYYEQEDMPIEGVTFLLYYVAEVLEDDVYVLSEKFQKYPVRLDNLDTAQWRALAKTLTYYVQADKLSPVNQGVTDESGMVTFPVGNHSLYPGLYLLDAIPKIQGNYIYDTEPCIICLPAIDDATDKWTYELDIQAKCNREEIQEESSGKTTERKVLKIWKEDLQEIRPKEVEVELLKNGVSYESITLDEDNNWRYTWPKLPVYDEQGIKIEWGIIEKKIENYTVSVSVEGTTFLLTNTYAPPDEVEEKVSRTVQKVWKDKGCEGERPKVITIYLLKNGVVYDAQVLSEEKGWKYTWEELPRLDEKGKEIFWSIREEKVEGYKSIVSQKEPYFILTNSIEKPTLPQTGVLWWPVPIYIALGLLFFILGHLLKGRQDNV